MNKNLVDLSIDEDYYKPIKNVSDFDNNDNYTECESKRDKDKTLSITEYLNMTRPYLRDITNDHKTQQEWKIQLPLKLILCLLKILMRLVLYI